MRKNNGKKGITALYDGEPVVIVKNTVNMRSGNTFVSIRSTKDGIPGKTFRGKDQTKKINIKDLSGLKDHQISKLIARAANHSEKRKRKIQNCRKVGKILR